MQRRFIKQLAGRVPKERKKGWWKKWLVLIPVLVLLSAFIYFVNLPEHQIARVNIEGEILTSESDIRGKAESELAGDYLFVVPKTFEWSYPKSSVEGAIEAMPSVLSAKADLDRKTATLNINIVERKQEYVWCRPDDGMPERQCYYMDKDGLVFVRSPQFEGHVFVTFEGLVDAEDPIGKSFLAPKDMANLLGFIEKLKSMGLLASVVSASTTREVHIGLRSGTDLIVSLEKPLDATAKSVDTLMRSPDFKEASGGINSINYIDLRYGSKAFWK